MAVQWQYRRRSRRRSRAPNSCVPAVTAVCRPPLACTPLTHREGAVFPGPQPTCLQLCKMQKHQATAPRVVPHALLCNLLERSQHTAACNYVHVCSYIYTRTEECGEGRRLFPAVVLVKSVDGPVLRGAGHGLQVIHVAYCLRYKGRQQYMYLAAACTSRQQYELRVVVLLLGTLMFVLVLGCGVQLQLVLTHCTATVPPPHRISCSCGRCWCCSRQWCMLGWVHVSMSMCPGECPCAKRGLDDFDVESAHSDAPALWCPLWHALLC